jgi:hypothetical protein
MMMIFFSILYVQVFIFFHLFFHSYKRKVRNMTDEEEESFRVLVRRIFVMFFERRDSHLIIVTVLAVHSPTNDDGPISKKTKEINRR